MAGAAGSAYALEARALTKSYGRHRGIVEVSLQVAVGEVVGLVGANGAGKTTLMRTVLDFIRPTAGSVTVLGLDSVGDSVAVRRRTAYLPGDLVLPPRLRGYEAVRRFTSARPPIPPGRVETLAERLDLDLVRPVGELSKGNRQKLGLVLAFAPEVELLVLDEPSSGLDPLLQREFAALVAETAARGVTVVLSSHVMAEVELLASRVALMREGRVVTVDELDALRARSRRRGRARPASPADVGVVATALQATPGTSEVVIEGEAVSFACVGNVDAMVKTLAAFDVASLDLVQPDLEDAFFSAYEQSTDRSGSRR